MNRRIFFTVVASAVLMTSCQVSRKALSSSDLNGQWNITTVENSAVKKQPYPYIGFDTSKKTVYGNSGCNQMMGSFYINGRKGKIELGRMASTMMACPDMELEQSVLRALGAVRHINSTDKEHVVLCDENKKPLLHLEKRFRVVPISDIKGEWCIVSVFGEKFPTIQQVPFANFDVEKKRITAYAGCNRLSASYTGENENNYISVSKVASTRMACPDMTVEQNVITALEQVRSFGVSLNGNLLLFSAGSNVVMELMRNK